MLTAMKIHGAIDAEGRCKHWHSPLDVVANKCAACGEYFGFGGFYVVQYLPRAL